MKKFLCIRNLNDWLPKLSTGHTPHASLSSVREQGSVHKQEFGAGWDYNQWKSLAFCLLSFIISNCRYHSHQRPRCHNVQWSLALNQGSPHWPVFDVKSPGQCMRQLLHQLRLHQQPTSLPHLRKLSHNSRTLSGLLVEAWELFLANACSTVNMGVKLDLKKIALHARNAEYNPKRFAAVIMRIRWGDHYISPGDK